MDKYDEKDESEYLSVSADAFGRMIQSDPFQYLMAVMGEEEIKAYQQLLSATDSDLSQIRAFILGLMKTKQLIEVLHQTLMENERNGA